MSKRQEILLVSGILLVAAFFRLYRLDQLPPGLHYDEAFNATQAQKVLAGIERPLYFTEDLTEEPMAIYTESIFFAFFGASPFSLRLISAVIGILTIAALYLLARQLFASRFAALISAFILAILYWHVNFSRLGMEPIFLPMMLTLGMGCWVRVFQPYLEPLPSPLLNGREAAGFGGWVLAGLFLALTQYTYKAALFVPILIVAFLATQILIDRHLFFRLARALAIFFATAVLVFAPLGLYFATHPNEFIERPSTVLVAPSSLLNNAVKVGGMFFLHGDDNPRSNLPGRAVLDPLLAIGFVIGIIACIARWKLVESRIMLLWLAVMVLPSVLTDYAPHFGRSIGAAPAVALVTAYGLTSVAEITRSRLVAISFILLALTFSAFTTFRDYFDTWASRTGQFDSFDVGLLSLAQKLREEPTGQTLFISPADASHYTIQFGLNGRQASSFDGRRVLVLPEPGTTAAYGIITRDDARSLPRLSQMFPSGRVTDMIYDFTAQPYAAIYRAQGPALLSPQNHLDARLGDTIALIGYDIERAANIIGMTIYWKSIAATREDYTTFVHLLDSSSQVIAQDDTRPGHGTYLTLHWRAGQVIVDDYRLIIPPNTPNGQYRIEIGMYVLATRARVRMTDASGARMENDSVFVERFTLP